MNPGFIIRDGDGVNQAYSLSFLNGNGSERFTMDASSGLISYATDYDIDNNAMPSTVYLNVKCQDATGETGNASVIIYIHVILLKCISPLFFPKISGGLIKLMTTFYAR